MQIAACYGAFALAEYIIVIFMQLNQASPASLLNMVPDCTNSTFCYPHLGPGLGLNLYTQYFCHYMFWEKGGMYAILSFFLSSRKSILSQLACKKLWTIHFSFRLFVEGGSFRIEKQFFFKGLHDNEVVCISMFQVNVNLTNHYHVSMFYISYQL